MTRPRIAAVTIGQTPRPDLLEPLRARADDQVDIAELGALDALTADQLPRRGRSAYPLTTRLRDGTAVTLDEADLAPLVQAAIDHAEDQGASVTLLLCAGGFVDVTARGSLVRPFDAAVRRLRMLGATHIGVVVPYPGQAPAARRKFEAAGFELEVVVTDLAGLSGSAFQAAEAVVLDYVGHPTAAVDGLRERLRIPVVDLGAAGADEAIRCVAAARMPALPTTR